MTVVFNALLVIVAAGASFFPIAYHVTTRGGWRRSSMGRHLMGYTTAAALLGWSGILRVFFPDLPGQEWLRIIALTLAAVFVVQRDVMLLRTQGEHEAEREHERTRP